MEIPKSLEWHVEEVLIQKLKLDARLAPQTFRHHETDGVSATDIFVVKAQLLSKQLEGVRGHEVSASVTFASGTLTPEESDQLGAIIEEAAYESSIGFDPGLPNLLFCSLEPGAGTQRIDTRKLRKRVVTFPFIAAMNPTGYALGGGGQTVGGEGQVVGGNV